MADNRVFRDVEGGRPFLSEKASLLVDGRREITQFLWSKWEKGKEKLEMGRPQVRSKGENLAVG